jgi:hypothetical protein
MNRNNENEMNEFYGGYGNNDIFGGGDDMPVDDMSADEMDAPQPAVGGGSRIMSFDDFLHQREVQQKTGGVRKPRAKVDENTEVLEGYDSFTIFQSSVGETGHRFISKSPYGAALKTATLLFNLLAKKRSRGDKVDFIIQKITKGSNRKLYAYTATNEILDNPYIIFNKDNDGNRIIMNRHGQVLRINASNHILNVNINGDAKTKGKGKKQVSGTHPIYDPKTTLKHKFSASEITDFDYTPYIFRKVSNKVKIAVAEVPEDLKPLQKNVADKQKDAAKKAAKKEKEAVKKAALKEKEAAKKAAKKEKEAMQKKKEKEAAKKAALKEKEAAKKAAKKEKEAMQKEKKAAAKADKPKKTKAEKAAKAAKADKPKKTKAEKAAKAAKADKPKKPRAKKTAAAANSGGYCGSSACGMNVY